MVKSDATKHDHAKRFNPFAKRPRFAANEKPSCSACNDYGYVRRETWNAEAGWEIQACSRCNHPWAAKVQDKKS